MSDPQAALFVWPPNTAVNLALGNTGEMPQQTAPNRTGFVALGAAGTVLKSNGPGLAPSYAPSTTTYTVYTSGSGTYNAPAGCSYLIVQMWGAGGGGARNSTTSQGGGGGGAYIKVRFAPGTYSYSVGTGGTGQSGTGSGTAGGNTTFSTLAANGGNGGTATIDSQTGGSATVTGALQTFLNIPGGRGSVGFTTISPGGSSFGGSSYAIAVSSVTSTPVDGLGPGVGGAGVNSSNYIANAGNGANGRIIITEVY